MPEILKIGFIINNCGPSQLPYQLINSANTYLATNDDVDFALFYHNLAPFVTKPNFGVFNLFEAFSYDGYMVATSLHSIARMVNWPGPNQNQMFYYVHDLDWLRVQPKDWAALNQLYKHDKVQLIARSKAHADIISGCWKKPIAIVEDCEVNGFIKVIRELCTPTTLS